MPARHVIVDGSNLATEGRSLPSLAQLDQAVREFLAENPEAQVTVVVDASFGHRIDPSELPTYEEAEVAGEVISPPAGAIGRGDAFLLRIAEKTGATVLSNDSFQEFHGEHAWLFDNGRLIGGKPVPGVGWIFMPRTPVRGQKSREVVKEAKRKKQAEEAPDVAGAGSAGGLDLAASRAKGRGKKVDRAIARATEEAVQPKSNGRRRRRSSGTPPADPVNEPLAFITFIAAHPLGSEVVGTVAEFSSHGAFVEADGARCYLPLSAMGNPPPRRAREVVSKGEELTFVVQALDPQRRGVELALPGFARIAGGPTEETVEAEIHPKAGEARRRREHKPGPLVEVPAPADQRAVISKAANGKAAAQAVSDLTGDEVTAPASAGPTAKKAATGRKRAVGSKKVASTSGEAGLAEAEKLALPRPAAGGVAPTTDPAERRTGPIDKATATAGKAVAAQKGARGVARGPVPGAAGAAEATGGKKAVRAKKASAPAPGAAGATKAAAPASGTGGATKAAGPALGAVGATKAAGPAPGVGGATKAAGVGGATKAAGPASGAVGATKGAGRKAAAPVLEAAAVEPAGRAHKGRDATERAAGAKKGAGRQAAGPTLESSGVDKTAGTRQRSDAGGKGAGSRSGTAGAGTAAGATKAPGRTGATPPSAAAAVERAVAARKSSVPAKKRVGVQEPGERTATAKAGSATKKAELAKQTDSAGTTASTPTKEKSTNRGAGAKTATAARVAQSNVRAKKVAAAKGPPAPTSTPAVP
jgi:hypothetical protein